MKVPNLLQTTSKGLYQLSNHSKNIIIQLRPFNSKKSIVSQDQTPIKKEPQPLDPNKRDFRPIDKYQSPPEESLKMMLKSRGNVKSPPKSFNDFIARFKTEFLLAIVTAMWFSTAIVLASNTKTHSQEISLWKKRLKRLKGEGDQLREMQLSERQRVLEKTNKELQNDINTIFKQTDSVLKEYNETDTEIIDKREMMRESLRKVEEKILKKS